MSTFKKLVGKGRFSDGGWPESTVAWKNVGRCGGCAAICDPCTSPNADNQQVPRGRPGSDGRHPLVAILLLLFIYRRSQMRWWVRELCLGCQEQSGSCWRRGFFWRGVDLAPRWLPADSRSSQRTEGERGRAICGTDMVDVSQTVPGRDGTEAGFHLNTFSHTVVKRWRWAEVEVHNYIYSCYCYKAVLLCTCTSLSISI